MMQAADIYPTSDLEGILDLGGDAKGVMRAVYDVTCHAGATSSDARSAAQEEMPDVVEMLVVIAESPAIPYETVSFTPNIPPEMRQRIIDGMPNGAAALAVDAARGAMRIQTGRLANYAFAMIIGLVVFVSIFFLGASR